MITFNSQFLRTVVVKLRIMNGHQEVSKQRGEDSQVRHDVIPLVTGHLDAPGQERDQGCGGGGEEGDLAGGGDGGPQLAEEGRGECEAVEEAVLVHGLASVEQQLVADHTQRPHHAARRYRG